MPELGLSEDVFAARPAAEEGEAPEAPDVAATTEEPEVEAPAGADEPAAPDASAEAEETR